MPDNLQSMIVAISGTDADARLLDIVGQFVYQHPVTITLVHVVEVAQSMPLDVELPNELLRGEEALRRAEHLAKHGLHHKFVRVQTELLQARSIGAAIVDEAIDRGADAIALAAINRRVYGRTTLGESVDYVLKNAPCEVFLIRMASRPSKPEFDSWQ
ncbi:MAG: universal stress protein [Chloroflexota bacterium]|nr:universal stress protein [Chloroflexota bacterium]